MVRDIRMEIASGRQFEKDVSIMKRVIPGFIEVEKIHVQPRLILLTPKDVVDIRLVIGISQVVRSNNKNSTNMIQRAQNIDLLHHGGAFLRIFVNLDGFACNLAVRRRVKAQADRRKASTEKRDV